MTEPVPPTRPGAPGPDSDAGPEARPEAPGLPAPADSLVVPAPEPDSRPTPPSVTETVEEPAKVMRIGSMIKQLLEEVRQAPLDEDSRTRLRGIYETSIRELAGGLSADLAAELDRLALPFDEGTPSESTLRIAQAQLVGWLEGLFHGIQATLFAQQMAARSQLEDMRRRGLPPGAQEEALNRPGTYL